MSRKGANKVPRTTAAEEEVADYLRAHPDFFDRHPRVLVDLEIHHKPGSAAVSLVQRQLALLRKQNAELQAQLADLVAVAKDNHALVEKIHQLAIGLMAQPGGERRMRRLRKSLKKDFAVERAVLILFSAPHAVSADDPFLKVVDPRDPGLKPFGGFLKSGRPRCGTLRRGQKRFVFGDPDVELDSAALIPLGSHAEMGFMVIGSRDPDYFHPGKRTDYLSQLGEVVSMALTGASGPSGVTSGPKASGT